MLTPYEQSQRYNESLRCLEGLGVQKNETRSFELNREAATEGHADAVLAMGWFYLNGTGVARDLDQARKWYRKSAKRGDTRAMFSLGQMAQDERDRSDAKMWFERAADADHHRSKFWLGKLYWRGRGVEMDKRRARQFFQAAADKKVVVAQRAIRFLNRKGTTRPC